MALWVSLIAYNVTVNDSKPKKGKYRLIYPTGAVKKGKYRLIHFTEVVPFTQTTFCLDK